MVHPIFSVLITKPELVMEHVAGYASLLREETSSVGKEVAKRAVAWGVTLFAFLVFLILAGVAAMLGALNAAFHWALVVVPGIALAIAVAGVGAGLNNAGVQIQVVRHHGGAEYADGDVENRRVGDNPCFRNEAAQDRHDWRRGDDHLVCEAPANDKDEARNQ